MKKGLYILASFIFAACTCNQPAEDNDLSRLTEGTTQTNCSWGHVEIAPGQEHVIAEIDGAGALKYFYITDGRGGITEQNLILRMYWDGNDYPSVNVPAADFFGSVAGRPIDWESRYIALQHNCHQCYFPMPFSKGAKVVLYNDGPATYSRDVAYNFDFVKDKAYKNNKSRFHAYYNRSNPTNGSHTILDVKGHGHYVGNILHVFTKSRRWWGEGDTDFCLDSKMMKHTPGTEDEYGACFDLGGKFSHAVCGYLEGGIPTDGDYSYTGHNRAYRFYEDNPVRFAESLQVTIQNQYCAPNTPYDFKGQQGANDDYTSVAYYYMEGAQPVELMPYSERTAESQSVIY